MATQTPQADAPEARRPNVPGSEIPQPSAPEPDAPETDAPVPDAPEPAPPESEDPEPTPPESDALETDAPEPVAPDPAQPDPVQPDPVQPDPVQPDPVQPDPVQPDPVEPGPVVPDPEVRNTTQVDFDITVPAYMSSALTVSVETRAVDDPDGTVTLAAAWLGDEFWGVSGELATNTEHDLVVTFFDDNGGIVLGRVETRFTTGANASESRGVTAEQFDTASWDEDGDGRSNLEELRTGTSPDVDESALMDVRESFHTNRIDWAVDTLSDTSAYYEPSVPAARPYSENTTNPPTEDCLAGRVGPPLSRIVEIDAGGTGTFMESYLCDDFADRTQLTFNATRTRVNDAVTWSGTYARSNSSAGVFDDVDFQIETTTQEDGTRRQVGTFDNRFLQSFVGNHSVSYDLTGKVFGDTSSCEADAGTITIDTNGERFGVMTISKEAGDPYWFVQAVDNDRILEEYLVESLGRNFYCVFDD